MKLHKVISYIQSSKEIKAQRTCWPSKYYIYSNGDLLIYDQDHSLWSPTITDIRLNDWITIHEQSNTNLPFTSAMSRLVEKENFKAYRNGWAADQKYVVNLSGILFDSSARSGSYCPSIDDVLANDWIVEHDPDTSFIKHKV